MGNARKSDSYAKMISFSWEQQEQLSKVIAELLDAWKKAVAVLSEHEQRQRLFEIVQLNRVKEYVDSNQTNRDDSIDIPALAVQNFVKSFDAIAQIIDDDTKKYNVEWSKIKGKLVRYLEKVKEE